MTKDELKTIIALSGDKRLSHLEDEIFASSTLAHVYLAMIAKILWPGDTMPNIISTVDTAPIIFSYAKRYLNNERWLAAEQYIIKDPQYAHWYATDIIRDRWHEAEQYIMKDEHWYGYYLQQFGIRNDKGEYVFPKGSPDSLMRIQCKYPDLIERLTKLKKTRGTPSIGTIDYMLREAEVPAYAHEKFYDLLNNIGIL